jgi:hypothetical protein
MAKVDKMAPEIKERLLASLNAKRTAPTGLLTQQIAEVSPNAGPANNNNGNNSTSNTGTGNPPTTGNSPTSATTGFGRSSNAEHSTRSGSASNGTVNGPSTTSTSERADNRNEPANTGTAKRNPIGAISINRVSNPVSGETDGGTDRGTTNGSENRGNPRRGTIEPPELAITPERTRKPRTPKSEPIDIEMLTFGIQTLFAGVGTLFGPHWAISQEAALSIAEPAKKCLDKLPASALAKVEKYSDPFALCMMTAVVLSGPLQVEAMIANRQLTRGQLPTGMNSAPVPNTEPATQKETANVSSPTTETPIYSTNGAKPAKSRFGNRFTNSGNVQGFK